MSTNPANLLFSNNIAKTFGIVCTVTAKGCCSELLEKNDFYHLRNSLTHGSSNEK